jgi:hypothetical protein
MSATNKITTGILAVMREAMAHCHETQVAAQRAFPRVPTPMIALLHDQVHAVLLEQRAPQSKEARS